MFWLKYEADKMFLPKIETIVETIKIERKKLGLTQRDLAKHARVSKSTVGKMEAGTIVPNYENVRDIYNEIEKRRKGEVKTAGDFVNKEIVSVKPSDRIKDAIDIMHDREFSQLLVEEDGHYIGLITIHQVVFLEEPQKSVRTLEFNSVPKVPSDTPKEDFKGLLDSSKAILVEKNGNVIGMVTDHDIR